jgi:hypothetical protein
MADLRKDGYMVFFPTGFPVPKRWRSYLSSRDRLSII